jgi:hypothetical protein
VPTTTAVCRAAILAVAAASAVWHDDADAAVQSVWDWMRASPWVQVREWIGGRCFSCVSRPPSLLPPPQVKSPINHTPK